MFYGASQPRHSRSIPAIPSDDESDDEEQQFQGFTSDDPNLNPAGNGDAGGQVDDMALMLNLSDCEKEQ